MALFDKIKKSFGFSDPEEDYDYDYVEGKDATVKKRESQVEPKSHYSSSVGISSSYSQNSNVENETPEQRMKKMQLLIFEGVVDLFNKSLPEFISSNLDRDAQAQYVFDSLDKSLRDYIVNISSEARRVCEAQWDKERSKIMSEMIELKSKYREIESTRDDWKRQQLSAERQKRALSARLHDLEVQVASLEAEKEQFSLENKSLVNKLKVSNLKDGNVEALQEEIERLQQALKEARQGSSAFDFDYDSQLAEKDEQIKKLQEQIELTQSNGLDDEKIKQLTEENSLLKKSLEQIKVKGEIADAMINDLNEKASTAMRQQEASQKAQEVAEQKITELEEQVSTLTTQLSEAKVLISNKDEELDEAQNGLKMIESIQSEMDKFEKIKKKKDSKIVELQKEIKLYKSQISQLEQDIESLKSTIENNLYNQAISEDRLKKEIEKLKDQTSVDAETSNQEVVISAIDDTLDDADWLISTPPDGTQMRSVSNSTDDDFGYQEPTKKTAPDNEAQMLLW